MILINGSKHLVAGQKEKIQEAGEPREIAQEEGSEIESSAGKKYQACGVRWDASSFCLAWEPRWDLFGAVAGAVGSAQ